MARPSTRAEILARMKTSKSIPPPASMSNEEMQALLRSGTFRAEPLKQLPRDDDEIIFERPPSAEDSPRHMAVGMSEKDRNFWFNLVIGCSGPDSTSKTVLPSNRFRSRNAATLAYAMSDVVRLRDFVNRYPMTGPDQVFPLGWRPFAGTFSENIILREATSADLDDAFNVMRSFFERNKDDPEMDGGQVNIFFAGHGVNMANEHYIDRGGLCLKDKVITTQDVQERLIGTLTDSMLKNWYGLSDPGNCRVDMYLDCCYSGQFVASFIGKILYTCKGLVPGRFWCSSMPFQESFESPEFQQGVFTYYFLSDYSTKKRSFFSSLFRGRTPSLRHGDVGRRTRSRQNPFLIDFSAGDGPLLTIPGALWTRKVMESIPITDDVYNGGDAFARWLTDYLQAVHQANWQVSED
jgi:hypothetical protein